MYLLSDLQERGGAAECAPKAFPDRRSYNKALRFFSAKLPVSLASRLSRQSEDTHANEMQPQPLPADLRYPFASFSLFYGGKNT